MLEEETANANMHELKFRCGKLRVGWACQKTVKKQTLHMCNALYSMKNSSLIE